MELFPAVFIGGPPHSGKSVLVYSLTQALRRRGVQHYVLRACPDGEGDWANEADQALVRTIRVKSDFTPEFVDQVCQDLARRHLPLLVDVGGQPKDWQEPIFAHCTHAVLLTKDDVSRRTWRARAERHALPILAEITSQLIGESVISAASPVLRGTMVGLERGQTAAGPLFDAVVDRLAALFAYDPDELRAIHYALAPVETVVDLDRLARTFGVPLDGEKACWEPRHLPQVLDYLPKAVPLGLYGRGPNWLYAGVALHVVPALFHQFDVRLGWVTPPAFQLGPPSPDAPLLIQRQVLPDHVRLNFELPRAYIDYNEVQELRLPPVAADCGLVLSGKLPHWLLTALAVIYAPQTPWLAVYQPQLNGKAVVIASKVGEVPIGTLVL